MTPTNWTGLLALCAVAGVVGAILRAGMYGGRTTKALEDMAIGIRDIRGDFKEMRSDFKTAADKIADHELRLGKVEFCLDINGDASAIVANLASHRRRKGMGES